MNYASSTSRVRTIRHWIDLYEISRITRRLLLVMYLSLVAAEASSQSCTAPPEGLVSWWPGEGNATDFQETNDGILRNGAGFAQGLVGSAFQFDWENADQNRANFVVFPGATNLDPLPTLTLETWVRLETPGGPANRIERFVTLARPDVGTVVIRHDGENNPGQLDFFMQKEWELHHIRVNGLLQTGVWHHVAGTYDGSYMRLYLDGVEVGNQEYTGFVSDGNGRTRISNPGEPINGLIDEASLYNRALDTSEIQTIYDAGSAGKCKPSLLVNAGVDQTVSMQTSVMLSGTARFYTGSEDDLIFAWVQVPTGPLGTFTPVQLDGAGTASPTFEAPGNIEILVFELTVEDTDGNRDSDEVYVTVWADVEHAVFVSQTLGNDASPGTTEAPLETLHEAVRRAQQTVPFSDIYVHSSGTYDETAAPLILLDDMSLFGRFEVQEAGGVIQGWTRDGPPTSILGASTAIEVLDITSPTIIDGFFIRSANGDGGEQTRGAGENAIGIYVRNATDALQITNNQIVAGRGGPGFDGSHGMPRDEESANRGGHGRNFIYGSGGNGGYSPIGRGGADGGDGGIYHALAEFNGIDELANDLTEDCVLRCIENNIFSCMTDCLLDFMGGIIDGQPGSPGSFAGGSGGGSWPELKLYCGFPTPSSPDPVFFVPPEAPLPFKVEAMENGDGDGRPSIGVRSGDPGIHGTGADNVGMVVDDRWISNSGQPGTDGTPGFGGGGGGGGGGGAKYDCGTLRWRCEVPPLAHSCIPHIYFGGGGGGGGAGGAGGEGGEGGFSGGASFGIFLRSASPIINNNIIETAGGGAGGDGGFGTDGQMGGNPGDGGRGGDISGSGGDGAHGGRGGDGGDGGGGSGGPSCGIYLSRASGSGVNCFTENCTIGDPGPSSIGLPGRAGGPNGQVGFSADVCPPPVPFADIPGGGTLQINFGVTETVYATVPSGSIPMTGGLDQAQYTVTWDGSDVVTTLHSPSGRIINRNTSEVDVIHDNGPTYEFYTIFDPEPGEWTIELFGADIPPGGEDVKLGITGIPKNSPPEARCRDTVAAADVDGTATASVNDNSFDADPGDPLTFLQEPAGPYAFGDTPVTLTIEDGWGAVSMCEATVTIVDQTPPEISLPEEITLTLNEGSCTAILPAAVVADNVDSAPVVISDAPEILIPGETTVTVTATDASGNSNRRSVVVTVLDETPPNVSAAFVPLFDDDDDDGDDDEDDEDDDDGDDDDGDDDDDDDERLFRIAFDATDCDPSTTSTGVIVLPLPEDLSRWRIRFKSKRNSRLKIKIREKKRRIEITHSQPEEIWDLIKERGGIVISNKQIVRFSRDKKKGQQSIYEFKKDGKLVIKAPDVSLLVTAVDGSGNTRTVHIDPSGTISSFGAKVSAGQELGDDYRAPVDISDLDRQVQGYEVSDEVRARSASLPEAIALNQNFPNPFNPSTQLSFELPERSEIRLTVYDMLGREVAVLMEGVFPAGRHEKSFEAGNLPSGTYVARLTTPQGMITRIMTLMK